MIRNALLQLLAAIILTCASTVVPGREFVVIPGSEDCPGGCWFVAAGWPLAWIVDAHGLSPANSADLLMALVGEDDVRQGALLADFVFWLAVSAAAQYGWRRLAARRDKPPAK